MVVIGGLDSIPGAVLGALYLVGPARHLRVVDTTIQFLTSGVGLMAFILYLPGGMAQVMHRLGDLATAGRREPPRPAARRAPPSPDTVATPPPRRGRRAPSPPRPPELRGCRVTPDEDMGRDRGVDAARRPPSATSTPTQRWR